ncbi:MAG: hypothetical protein ACTSWC_03050 [Promethearchaeota archaeon]
MKNRPFSWIEIKLPFSLKKSKQLVDYLKKELIRKLQVIYLDSEDLRIFLTLKGYQPDNFSRNRKAFIRKELMTRLNLVDHWINLLS